jgi:peptide-methionine (S)-S-oxide reductase
MWRKAIWLLPVGVVVAVVLTRPADNGFTVPEQFPSPDLAKAEADAVPPAGGTELATFGSGCFWCTEAVFQQIKGVTRVVSGYSGGSVPHPTYSQICTGTTGHAEVVQVTFDPAVVSYPELLEVFWRSHDPTTRNRQGHDTGPQYRSVVFTHTDQQRQQAERYMRAIDAAAVFPNPLVTEVVPFAEFYPADAGHQNYFAANPGQPYCRAVIGPKVEKLRAVFRDKLKTD